MRISHPAAARLVLVITFGVSGVIGLARANAQEATGVDPARVDGIFERFDGTANPGCAVGVTLDGRLALSRAYGMADLEHDVPNTPETVFEPGSVAKQFTAAATVLLSLDGKLSLDDDVRRFIPELPDYGETVTIRHLLNHTSGLRDWGSVAGIGGWPRTTRVHTHEHVLDIVSRQRSLNYPPGEYYSYTNTGYNLQAVLVERVSGRPFADFTRERLFKPLGMTRTEWRDDFTRIVKDRAVAYSPSDDGGFRMNMPFENVHGNGGLLTTVGDLLRWTRNLETGEVGGPKFLEEMHRQGVLDSGRQIAYASGLRVGEYRGVREVNHSGSTAGYRGFLTRFPDHGVAVAVMCNAANGNAGQLAHRTAELYLADAVATRSTTQAEPAGELSPSAIESLAGGYRNARTEAFVRLTVTGDTLQVADVPTTAISRNQFAARNGMVVEFDNRAAPGTRPTALLTTTDGDTVRLEPVAEFEPTAAELAEYAGAYYSDEAEAIFAVEVDDGVLVVKSRYGMARPINPVYPDTFNGERGTYIFRRDDTGRIVGLSLGQSRVWDMRFERIP